MSYGFCIDTVDFCSMSITIFMIKCLIFTEARSMWEGNVYIHAYFISIMRIRSDVGVFLYLNLEEVVQFVAEQHKDHLVIKLVPDDDI